MYFMLKKLCRTCNKEKRACEFHKQRRNKDGLQSVCKTCRKELDKKYHSKRVVANKKRYKFTREYVDSWKRDHGCACCEEVEPVVLEFHHPDNNKEFAIASGMVAVSFDRLKAEIAKCVVVCANCHRKLHAGLLSDLFDLSKRYYNEGMVR